MNPLTKFPHLYRAFTIVNLLLADYLLVYYFLIPTNWHLAAIAAAVSIGLAGLKAFGKYCEKKTNEYQAFFNRNENPLD